jgi:hypothetical protein
MSGDQGRRALRVYLGILFSLAAMLGLLVAGLHMESGASLEARPKLSIKVSPLAGMAPLDVRVTIQIEPDPANAAAVVVYAGDNEFRSSYIQLDGELAPKTHVLTMKNIPGGHCVFSVEVYNSEGKLWAQTSVHTQYIGLTYQIPDWADEAMVDEL